MKKEKVKKIKKEKVFKKSVEKEDNTQIIQDLNNGVEVEVELETIQESIEAIIKTETIQESDEEIFVLQGIIKGIDNIEKLDIQEFKEDNKMNCTCCNKIIAEPKRMMNTGVCIPNVIIKDKIAKLHTIPHPAGY